MKKVFDNEVIATYAVFAEKRNKRNTFKFTGETVELNVKRSELKKSFYGVPDPKGLRKCYVFIAAK